MLINLRIARFRAFRGIVSDFSTTKQNFSEEDENKDRKPSITVINSIDKTKSRKEAVNKLQELLANMAKEQVEEKTAIKTARPVKRAAEKRPTHKVQLNKMADRHAAQLVTAVQGVADELGGGPEAVKATESELLHVILNNKRPKENISEEKKPAGSVESVLTGMKVEPVESRATQVRRVVQRTPRQQFAPQQPRRPINLFNGERLNIFPENYSSVPEQVELPTWSKLYEKELKLLITHPPSNIYQEMVRWTEQGKLWSFPIDNELGLEEEKKCDFTQHVFLDEHLEGWCPAEGPIRHFMELVLVGLAKNPYITVQAKIAHIHWFRDYFEGKKKILLETGAISAPSQEQTAA